MTESKINENFVSDIVNFGDLHESQLDCLLVSEVTFLRDFGCWKEKEVVDSLCFDFDNGTVKEFDEKGNITKQCKLHFEAIEVKE